MAKRPRAELPMSAVVRLSENQVGIIRRGDRALIGISFAGEVVAHAWLSLDQVDALATQARTIARQIRLERRAIGKPPTPCARCGKLVERESRKGQARKYCPPCREIITLERQRIRQERDRQIVQRRRDELRQERHPDPSR